jgi:hypothetical protein
MEEKIEVLIKAADRLLLALSTEAYFPGSEKDEARRALLQALREVSVQ